MIRQYEGGKPSPAVLEEHCHADHLYDYSNEDHCSTVPPNADEPMEQSLGHGIGQYPPDDLY